MKKLVLLISCLLVIVTSCKKNNEDNAEMPAEERDYIEILYFDVPSDQELKDPIVNPINQLLDNDFSDAVKDEKLVFKQIDITSEDGAKMAKEYNVKQSALFVNHWIGTKEMRKNMTVLAKKNAAANPEIYREELSKLLTLYLTAPKREKLPPMEKIGNQDI